MFGLLPRSIFSRLGEGTRSPGFDPYLNFAIESVFLKLQSRAYARKEEKWEVSEPLRPWSTSNV